ncbi:MAG TPA: formylglycine-generating enzyme family protein [Opitutaceae bacterium]|nr:formylglycine-generating enzyme family protein [Opitutaceae bacterium]
MKAAWQCGLVLPLLFLTAAAAAAEERPTGPIAGEAWNVPLAENTSLPLAWIPPGAFTLGSPATEPGRKADEGPATQVTLSRGFWLGRTLVTIGQWKKVMGVDIREHLVKRINDDTLHELHGKKQTLRALMGWSRDADPATYLANEDENLPMYFISWNDAMGFARELNERERAAGRLPAGYEYTLPTEAQWENACRAGSTDATHAGPVSAAVLDRIAWYDQNSARGYEGRRLGASRSGPREVGQKEPNAWGLFDMSGNVWQWCRDWYGPYPGGNVTDPQGPLNGTARVNRGGSFGSGANSMRSACRASNPQAEASAYRGFRLALSPEKLR